MKTRPETILYETVQTYIDTGEPVGSKHLIQKPNVNFSSATVRSELSKLVHEGYLSQPHASAGRIPTDIGYRYYVDNIPQGTYQSMLHQDQNPYDHILENISTNINDTLIKMSRMMTRLLNYATIILHPDQPDTDKSSSKQQLRVLIGGMSKIMGHPEFQNIQLIKNIVTVLEDDYQLSHQLQPYVSLNRYHVAIGSEIENSKLENCSLVIAPFSVKKRPIGLIGVLGPKRMRYHRMVPMMQSIAETITNKLKVGIK